MLKVQNKQCSTCIYTTRSPSRRSVEQLEREIADKRMSGHFTGARLCHHSNDVVCRGFWNRHKDHYDAGQLAQRLKLVAFVDVDNFKK